MNKSNCCNRCKYYCYEKYKLLEIANKLDTIDIKINKINKNLIKVNKNLTNLKEDIDTSFKELVDKVNKFYDK